jgi:hypothetical protein
LTLDEADFKRSEAWSDIIKILNNGYEPGTPVIRSVKMVNGNWEPESWQVFGPKIIASRQPFSDQALESRCLTTVMRETTREDIPLNIPQCFYDEVNHLRNKLLLFRFRNLNIVGLSVNDNSLLDGSANRRLKQILMSLAAVVHSENDLVQIVKNFGEERDNELSMARRETLEARTLEAIVELHRHGTSLSMIDIANNVSLNTGHPVNARKIGEIVRRILCLPVRTDSTTNRSIVVWQDDSVMALARNYGITSSL